MESDGAQSKGEPMPLGAEAEVKQPDSIDEYHGARPKEGLMPLGAEANDVRPQDSVSNVGSRLSSTSSARQQAIAKMAALQVESSRLKAARRMEAEMDAYNMETKRLMIQAEIDALSEAGSEVAGTKHEMSHDEEVTLKIPKPEPPRSSISHERSESTSSRIEGAYVEAVLKQQSQLINVLRAPSVTIPSFNGDPLQYFSFIRSFEENVERTIPDGASRLARLAQLCTGDAGKLIKCCLLMDPEEGYSRARALLKRRFGDEFTISSLWIQQLTQAPQRSLREYADELRCCQEALQAMGYTNELNTQGNLLSLVQRLPAYLQNRWRTFVLKLKRKQHRQPMLEDVVEFVEDAAEEECLPVYGVLKKEKPNRQSNFNVNMKLCCLICDGDHEETDCEALKRMTYEEREKNVREKRLCFICLKPGHISKECESQKRCAVDGCGRRHDALLHNERYASKRQWNIHTPQSSQGPIQVSSSYVSGRKIALPIVAVDVRAPGSRQVVRTHALLDSGSTNTFCTEALLKKLGVKGREENISLTTLCGEDYKWDSQVTTLEVANIETDERVNLACVYSKKDLRINTNNIATFEDIMAWPHLKGLPIPKVGAEEVTILIGQDCPDALLPLHMIKGNKGEPYATRTHLGWTLNGPLKGTSQTNRMTTHFVGAQELGEKLDRFWNLESSGLYEDRKEMSVKDREVMDKWRNEATMQDGHHQLPIPFRQETPGLPDNKELAEARLASLRRKLDKNDDLKAKYCEGMEDLLQKGHAVKVPESEIDRDDGKVWYLPHHPVINPNKDKIRIVFDCAAQSRGTSLNEQVLQGPDLTNKLIGVLARYRLREVAFMADIEAMFHQVKVPVEDQDVLRFMWWPGGDMHQKPEVYRMTVHLFGGTWSPSCCTYALHRTAEDNAENSSEAAVYAIKQNFYVDDCLKSVDTDEEAIELTKQLKMVLKKGGFNLTKWTCNRATVLDRIPAAERSKRVKERTLDSPLEERALGVYWNVECDELSYRIQTMNKPHTKRGLLSMLSSIYDPLGLASPFILKARKIVQDLCRKGVGWDDPIPGEQLEEWLQWTKELCHMENIKFPRCVKPKADQQQRLQLHHFADASEKAYGVVSYLRCEDALGNVTSTLVMAKSRLAPLKQITIPRLELCAATLASRQDTLLRRELDVDIEESHFWTDSTIVLQYIKNEERRFHTFVANRVMEIRGQTEVNNWHHVPTKENPADDASRGTTAKALSESRWVNGPRFLKLDRGSWPALDVPHMANDDPEVKGNPQTFATVKSDEHPLDKLLKYFSSWTKLLKSTAWILAVKDVLRKKTSPTKLLRTEDLEAAEEVIVKHVQRSAYASEMRMLEKEGHVSPTSSLVALQPVLQGGVMCIGGRLKNAAVPEEMKHAVILPKESALVNLLVTHIHEKTGHAGREYVLAELRQRYWVTGGRTTVKRMLNRCIPCKIRSAQPQVQRMADLPTDRVTPGEPAFSNVGVDYFGPFLVRRGRGTEKRYGCLFTCLATRAIHIEIAHSLDTSSFINCLHRFIARRGRPKVIRSDNGTNFVGAERELRQELRRWNEEKIQHVLNEHRIKWIFNPPLASHMGGVWERQIRTVRRVLTGLTKEQVLTDEMLTTLMCVAEGIVNNRPITTLSDDPKDLNPLTPNHLLLLRPAIAPPGLFSDPDLYSRKKWRQVQYLSELFWKRWTREYLPQLQQRTKWTREERNVRAGDVVLVIDNPLPRNEWLLGRILKVHKGSDQRVRTVTVKTKNSELVRPVQKICLLEATGDDA